MDEDENDKDLVKASGQVVLDLSVGLPPGAELVFDNYFTSVDLLKVLTTRGLFGTGTIRLCRLVFFFEFEIWLLNNLGSVIWIVSDYILFQVDKTNLSQQKIIS